MYYRGAAAAILVFDITREVCPLLLLRSFCIHAVQWLKLQTNIHMVVPTQSSFQTLRAWMNELSKHGPPNIVLAVAGNKSDLEEMREVSNRGALTDPAPASPQQSNILLSFFLHVSQRHRNTPKAMELFTSKQAQKLLSTSLHCSLRLVSRHSMS